MSLYDYIQKETKKEVKVEEAVLPVTAPDAPKNANYDVEGKGHPDAMYFNMLDPMTGFRYDIPMLRRDDPAYFYKYVDYMKMKEQNEDTFKKIMDWE